MIVEDDADLARALEAAEESGAETLIVPTVEAYAWRRRAARRVIADYVMPEAAPLSAMAAEEH